MSKKPPNDSITPLDLALPAAVAEDLSIDQCHGLLFGGGRFCRSPKMCPMPPEVAQHFVAVTGLEGLEAVLAILRSDLPREHIQASKMEGGL